jgi:hypothetical protein
MLDVTLLYFDECPNWRQAEDNLRAALRGVGRTDIAVRRREVTTVDDAERLGLHGSPTVLLDGVDPFAVPDSGTSLSCRLYRTENGSAGAPSVAQLRHALGETGAFTAPRSTAGDLGESS